MTYILAVVITPSGPVPLAVFVVVGVLCLCALVYLGVKRPPKGGG